MDARTETDPRTAAAAATLSVYVKRQLVYSTLLDRDLRLGRQLPDDPAPYARHADRVIIARPEESDYSRHQLLIAAPVAGKVRLTNTSDVNPIVLGDGELVAPSESRVVILPSRIRVGENLDREIRIEPPEEMDARCLESIGQQVLPPGAANVTMQTITNLLQAKSQSDSTQLLLRGLQSTIDFFHLSMSSEDLLAMAAGMLVDLLGVDTAAALTYEDGDWSVQAVRSRQAPGESDEQSWSPSRRILNRLAAERATCWRVPTADALASLDRVEALIAAPILNRQAEVIGALYGDHRLDLHGARGAEITEIEAIVVELLASSVAAAFARLEHVEEAGRARALFEQFFTPQLSRQLQAEPGLLNGKDTLVTLLCCNIRGFSRVSEQLGARLTIDWISDVMGTLSGCVTKHEGVLVDTLGDELIGMWGAPIESDQHARQASRAAFDMLAELPALNRRWKSVLERPIAIGAGLHTGVTRVGNIGSVHKLKYGPLGKTVTLVRQVASLTEQFQVSLMTTGATLPHLDQDSPTRRLGSLDDDASDESIAIYELATEVTGDWSEVKRFYESALKSFDRNDLTTATKMLGRLLADHPGDWPALQLLAKIAAMSESGN